MYKNYAVKPKGASRPSSIPTLNCSSFCEHLLFVQYKTKAKEVRGFNNIFFRAF